MSYNKEELLQLPIEEKISLVGDLWDSIPTEQKPLTDWKTKLIKNRMAKN